MKTNENGKKGLIAVLVILVFLLPIVLASLFLRDNLSSDLTKGSVEAVVLAHGKDSVRVVKKEEIEFFISAANSGDPIEKAANDWSEYRLLEVTFEKFGREYLYRFYLSDSENNCVYTDPAGSIYLLPTETALKLQGHALLNDYALSFSEFPVATMILKNGEGKSCRVSGEWSYVRADGEETTVPISSESEDKVDFPRGEKMEFQFALEPDYCHVVITAKDGEELFSNEYSKMETLRLENDTELTVTLTCDWFEDKEISYHGKITYVFDVFYNVPTTCVLDRESARAGESLTLTVAHSSTSQLAVNPSFSHGKIQQRKEGDTWKVTIPVSEDAIPGDFTVMVMGSDVEETMNVTILPAEEEGK